MITCMKELGDAEEEEDEDKEEVYTDSSAFLKVCTFPPVSNFVIF